jgi:hypothetical protein
MSGNSCWTREGRLALTLRGRAFYIGAVRVQRAPMAELVDASDSKSDSARSAGSIPARGTISYFPFAVCCTPRYAQAADIMSVSWQLA